MTTPVAEAALLDETVDLILDARNALCELLADSMPDAELETLLRELTAEVLHTYSAVVGDLQAEQASR